MGTNYYATLPGDNACPHCGRGDNQEVLHIGKSSGGWCFSLHVIPERGLNTLDDWKKLLATPSIKIRDEYGKPQTFGYALSVITERSWPNKEDKSLEWYRQNHATSGPNGLVRHVVDGRHTVGNGEGTWDYCAGEFS